MSKYADHWRDKLAFGLSVAVVSVFAVSQMTCTALAQDQGSWSAASVMPTPTADPGVAALDGKIYVVGGAIFFPHVVPTSADMGSGTWGSSVNYEYDPATGHWRELAPLPIGLSHVGVVGFNHKLYAFGGFTSLVHANAQDAALVYDPAANAWQWLAPLSSRRGDSASSRSAGKFMSSAAGLATQRRSTSTKSTTQRPISGPKKHQCRWHAIIWVSQSSMAKSTSSADAPEVKPTTSMTTTSMIRRRTNGQKRHPCRPLAAAGRQFITMGCCSSSAVSARSAIQTPGSAVARILTRTRATIRKRIRG